VSFDVRSGRYTGKRYVDVAEGRRSAEDVFWFRPVGVHVDRKGRHYNYTEIDRGADIIRATEACKLFAGRMDDGWSEEHARDMMPFNPRQDYVFSANARAMMHLFSVRGTADVQLECRFMAQLVFDQFAKWMPETADWFENFRAKKNFLAP
jgi:thymidylate synthase (FAD)